MDTLSVNQSGKTHIRFKQSVILKAILIVFILVFGGVFLCLSIHSIYYLEDYAFTEKNYKETYKFQQLYLKYAERAAVYVTYREQGYLADPNSIYVSSDLSSMLNGTASGNLRPSESVYTPSQESFEYYNRILNYDCKSFYYYIKNIKTGEYYYSPNFSSLIGNHNVNSTYSSKTIEEYLTNINSYDAYLIINTSNERYYTNINKNNHNYINDINISWIIDFITSQSSTKKKTESSISNSSIDNTASINSYVFGASDYVYDGNETSEKEDTSIIVGDKEIIDDKKIIIESNEQEISTDSNIESSEQESSTDSNIESSEQESSTDSNSEKEGQLLIQENEYQIYTFVIDSEEQLNDEFYNLRTEFNSRYELFHYHIKWLIAISAGLLLFIILYSICVGHKKGVEGIYLSTFDKIYTEVSIVLLLTGIVAVLLSLRALYGYMYLINNIYAISVIAYIFVFFIGIYGFSSLIRRLKSHTLIKNSISYLLIYKLIICNYRKLKNKLKSIPTLFLNRHAAIRLLFTIAIFSCLQAVAYLSTYNEHEPEYYVLFVVIIYFFMTLSLIKTYADMNLLINGTKKISGGDLNAKIPLDQLSEPAKTIANDINSIGDGLLHAVDEKFKSEHLKTELITNVSHDIKTPLTSIINYVDLLNKENFENDTAKGYLKILSEKSWRLKILIEDLVEASKASSGAITLNLERLNLVELIKQALGEFDDRFLEHNLEPVFSTSDENIYIHGDGRSTYRIIENLFSNANKYALENTRIYVDISRINENAMIQIKNISATKLGVNGDELMERFVRGDTSRNSEGSGLGLSITKSLTALQQGTFQIILDGDLFKTIVTLPLYQNVDNEEKE